jgi:hypothetical protein
MATRAHRINEVLKRFSPKLKAMIDAGEPWGDAGSPYAIDEWRGKTRIILTDPETGDTVGGTGATIDEALSALEAKVQ